MKELVIELMEAPSCCKEASYACQKYLDSLGSDKENEMLELLIKEIKEDINTIDDFILFLKTDMAKQFFGDKCESMLENELTRKEKGEKYCSCPACQACEKILNLYNK